MNIPLINVGLTMNESDSSLKPAEDATSSPVQEAIVFEMPATLEKPASMPEAPAAGPSAALGLGAQLGWHREMQGLSVAQIAAQLNLAPRQVVALEADNFDALPGMASVRGFVRSYAKLLKIAPEPLLALLVAPTDVSLVEPVSMRRALSEPFNADSRIPIMGSQGRNKSRRVLVPLAIVLLLALFGIYKQGWLAPLLGSPVQSKSADSAPSDDKANLKSDLLFTPGYPVDAAAPVAMPGAPESNNAPAAPAVPVTAATEAPAAAAKVMLLLKFNEDCWFDLRRNDGNSRNSVIAAHVGKAGTTESFDQADARSLTIGNAKGVEVFLYGTPVDLKTNANGNVVRINLK